MQQTRGLVRRSIGAIDNNISPSVPIPPMPSWVAGRFYSSYALGGAVGDQVAGNVSWSIPVIVPNDVVATSIGVNVTGAGTAGALIRLAIYKSSPRMLPDVLLLDAGTVAGDAVAYASVAISLYMRPGHYWLSSAFYTPTTYPTLTSLGQTSFHFTYSTATQNVPAQGYQTAYSVSGSGPKWTVNGFPTKMYNLSGDSTDVAQLATIGSSHIPRILLGV